MITPRKDKRLEKKENRLVAKGYKAVDEGREKKADRLLGRAANIQDRRIRMSEKRENSIKNPENREFVVEAAFNNNKKPKNVTQKEFNERYDIPKKRKIKVNAEKAAAKEALEKSAISSLIQGRTLGGPKKMGGGRPMMPGPKISSKY